MPQRIPAKGNDLQQTIAWAINGTPLSIDDLGKADAYLALLDATIFTPDWMEAFRRRLLHPHRPSDPERVLREFGRPILILNGEHDLTFPLSVAQWLHDAVPSSELVVIPNCGHQAQFEQPDAWASAVTTFLDR